MTTELTENKKLQALADFGPAWLTDIRKDALQRLNKLGYPDRRDEVWRFTDLSLLKLEEFEVQDSRSVAKAEIPDDARTALHLAGVTSGGEVIHADGLPVEANLSDEARKAGVIFADLDTAVEKYENLIKPRLSSLVGASEDIFAAWNLALHRGGSFLYVPKGVKLEAPLQSLHWLSREGVSLSPRTVVIVEEGAEIVFNDIYSSGSLKKPSLVSPVTEVFAAKDAKVGWVTWQDWGPGVRHIARIRSHLDERASLNSLVVTLGGSFSRTWKECTLAGKDSRSEMLGLYFSHEDQHLEHWTVQDHRAPNTFSDLLYKGALADESRSVYYGTIKVSEQARGTDAYQANRNLNLSPKAKADTNPQLEIATNDVRCTHGATVGKINPEHLFYLNSRGIEKKVAEKLLVFGFFNEVLDRVQWSGMQENLAEVIRAKLEGTK